ncbi:6-bladed beta-propeller [Gemmatimonadota bacterium]
MRGYILLAGLILAGCAGGTGGLESDWAGERRTDGSVTTVRTLSGSVWGGVAQLVEEASIGTPDGADEYLLGRVQDIDCDGERIYVLDAAINTIRVYDLQGNHITSFGRVGSGPGEFRQPRSAAVNPADGYLYVRDGEMSRIGIFSPEGEVIDHWQLFSGWQMSRELIFADDGKLYTPALQNIGSAVEEWRFGMISWGPNGALGDTFAQPVYEYNPRKLVAHDPDGDGTSTNNVPFFPEIVWYMSRDRVIVSGVATEYRFDVRFPDGRKVVVEREYEPVPVDPAEERWYFDAYTANMRNTQPGWAWNGAQIPNHKAAYDGLYPDLSDRVWVRRPGPGVIKPDGVEEPLRDERSWWRNPYWADSYLVDVFEFEGRFLGEVDIPDGFDFDRMPYIRNEMVIALVEGADGTPYVKRYRLVLPGGEADQ